eukprot:3405291-Amphidinium_carterae.1
MSKDVIRLHSSYSEPLLAVSQALSTTNSVPVFLTCYLMGMEDWTCCSCGLASPLEEVNADAIVMMSQVIVRTQQLRPANHGLFGLF